MENQVIAINALILLFLLSCNLIFNGVIRRLSLVISPEEDLSDVLKELAIKLNVSPDHFNEEVSSLNGDGISLDELIKIIGDALDNSGGDGK